MSRINPVSSYGEHARWFCEAKSQVQEPWGVWRGFSDLSKVGLICSGAEEEERRMREILKIENGGSPLKCVVLTSSVSGFGSFL